MRSCDALGLGTGQHHSPIRTPISAHIFNAHYCTTSNMYHEENHEVDFCKEIRDLWLSRKLCDVNVMVESDSTTTLSISAHKVVLAAKIPFFRTMFTAPGHDTSSGQVILKDLERDAVKRIMGYAYSGKLEITDSTVRGTLAAAATLGLSNVVGACVAHIAAQLTPATCLGVKRFATRHGIKDLRRTAKDYAVKNFLSVVQGDEFLQLSAQELESLVRDEHININKEEEVYEAVRRWIEHDHGSRHPGGLRLYNHIRFPVMPYGYLTEVVSNDPLLTSAGEGHLMLKEALDYHINPSAVFTMTSPHKAQPRSSTQGFVCILGGTTSKGEVVSDVTILNPHEQAWRQGTKMNTPRCRFSAVILNGDLYAIGGTDLNAPMSKVEKFSAQTGGWSEVAPLTNERRDFAAVAAGKRIFVLGGFSGSVFLKSAEVYNPDLDEWSYHPAMLEGRSELATVYMNKQLYAIGGFSDRGKLRSVERFDFLNRTWEPISDMCTQRANLAATVIGQEIFVCGGQIDGQVLNHAEIYNVELNQWEPIAATMAEPRMGASMVTMGNMIYIMGGSNGVEHLSSVECYDSAQHKWLTGPALPDSRFGAAAVVLSKNDSVATTVQ